MSQQNNNVDIDPEKKEELKDQVKDSIPNEGKTFYTDMVKAMLVDYVVNDLSLSQLAEKFHISPESAKKIYKSYNFQKRKDEYHTKLHDAVLKKVAKTQTGLIAKITEAITIQVNRILVLQAKDPNYMISSNHMKDLLTSLTIFTKEFRAETEATGNKGIVNINVQMPKHIPIVTENRTIVDITAEPEVEPEKKPEPEVEVVVETTGSSADLLGGLVD